MASKRGAAALGATTSSKTKQGSLFSFFSKKPAAVAAAKPKTTCTAEKVTVSSSSSPPSRSSAAAATAPPAAKAAAGVDVEIGSTIEVFWPDDATYYGAKVLKQRNSSSSFYEVEYSVDGTREWIDLTQHQFREKQLQPASKRRKVGDDDDDDSECEFEGGVSSCSDEESAYDGAEAEDDDAMEQDDEDDKWMVSDDEDDAEVAKKKLKKTKKRVKVTAHQPTTSSSTTTPAKHSSSANSTRTNNFQTPATPKTVTPSMTSFCFSQSTSRSTPSLPRSSSKSSHSSPTPFSQQSSTPTSKSNNGQKHPMFQAGVVNPAGSHLHNHLPFLQNPRDLQGRPVSHPDHDPRTLKVSEADWKKLNDGKKMTNAVQQWWDLKSRYRDTVLLFKTGKFYEIFHMDADVAVTVCGLTYMKGSVAHCGFPEITYAKMADRLVRAGYKVARVEQTETPQMLAERKKQRKKGQPVPKVVNREVCSILTLGTRTFCYLDVSSSEAATAPPNGSNNNSVGPLLAIREVLYDADAMDQSNDDGDAAPPPAAEYGVTLIDAVHGSVTIGQFADDVLRTRLDTLLTTFAPSEILIQPGGEEGASETLQSLLRSALKTSLQGTRLEIIRGKEQFAQSTALDPQIRQQLERPGGVCQPWDATETLKELHRRQYYPKASKRESDSQNIGRWPAVLQAAVNGQAELALSSFGAALFYLQRNLIDGELLSMGIVKAYIPPSSSTTNTAQHEPSEISALAEQSNMEELGLTNDSSSPSTSAVAPAAAAPQVSQSPHRGMGASPVQGVEPELSAENDINHMALDGTTLHNLEILYNSVDHKVTGSLWSKINRTKTPHGSRLLRAWLLRPLFRKADIERRSDAVEELVSGALAMARDEAVRALKQCGDIERLLARVHSMSGATRMASGDDLSDDQGGGGIHPNERAVLYETATYTKRKVEDFSKVLRGLQAACQLPEIFNDMDIQSGLLAKIVRLPAQGGCFPDMEEELNFFFDNFDIQRAAKGMFEPSRGVDAIYDQACEEVSRIEADLASYKEEMCNTCLEPRSVARSSWKYINLKPDSKDKYTIELPANVRVPENFIMKSKRGSGAKQVNRYRTADLEQLVEEYEHVLGVQKERKARGMQLIFANFDLKRNLWAAAAQATALLDALCALAQTASKPGYSRAKILDCPPDASPTIRVIGGRHPCVEDSENSKTEFVPNDLELGSEATSSRVLLLSGPNMGGKSTLLRQTCLISILAQIGCFVPAEECELTPIDRVYTRLGASDRILLGQSTFFVELAETAAALRGATRRSLVIMDELGRGTSTFDGTAIASSVVKHLIERSGCLSLFATHYHSLLEEWKLNPNVLLGHMECLVENGQVNDRDGGSTDDSTITFLYTLGKGVCPKSFGINVARLAGLPDEVLTKAKRISSEFEAEMSRGKRPTKSQVEDAIASGDWARVAMLWKSLQL